MLPDPHRGRIHSNNSVLLSTSLILSGTKSIIERPAFIPSIRPSQGLSPKTPPLPTPEDVSALNGIINDDEDDKEDRDGKDKDGIKSMMTDTINII